jgi:hypothetical protein
MEYKYNTHSSYDSILNMPLYCDIPRRCQFQLIDCRILVSPPRQFLRCPSSPVVNVELANSLFIFASFVYYFGTSTPRRASTTSENNNNNDDAIDSSAGSVPLKGRAGHGANFSFWGSMGGAPDLAGWLWLASRLIFSFHLRQWQRNHFRPTFQYYSPSRKG